MALVGGQRERLDAIEAEVQRISDRLKQPNFQLRVDWGKSYLAWLDGRFAEAIAITDRSMAEARQLGLTEYAADQSIPRKSVCSLSAERMSRFGLRGWARRLAPVWPTLAPSQPLVGGTKRWTSWRSLRGNARPWHRQLAGRISWIRGFSRRR